MGITQKKNPVGFLSRVGSCKRWAVIAYSGNKCVSRMLTHIHSCFRRQRHQCCSRRTRLRCLCRPCWVTYDRRLTTAQGQGAPGRAHATTLARREPSHSPALVEAAESASTQQLHTNQGKIYQ